MTLLCDRYLFIEKNAIGRGSFAKVYMGTDTETDFNIAVKVIDITRMNNSLKDRLYSEIRILMSIGTDHPNIVKTFDISRDSTNIYIIMEYCSNDFEKLLGNTRMKESKVRYYAKQLSAGLKYLRDHNIVHRDLKPANLLLSDDNRILKVCDFGFARVLDEATLTDTVCGSFAFMSPEVLQGHAYGVKSDLWSVGVILYRALYGRYIFSEARSQGELIKAFKTENVIYPKNVHVSPQCLDLLNGLLQKDPVTRISWTEFFHHPWFHEATTPISQISEINRMTRSEPINIRGHEHKQISISFSPNVIESYCSDIPRETRSDIGCTNQNEPIVIQSPSVLSESSSSQSHVLVPNKNNASTDERYLSFFWEVMSSSLRTFSIFN